MMQEKLDDNALIHFDVDGKIPHKDDMLLIDGIALKDGDIVRLLFKVPAGGNIFTDSDNLVAPLAMIEMLAQLCGAQHAFDQETDEPLNGFLMGIDKVRFHQPVYLGDTLALAAWKILEMKEIKRVKGEVHRNGELVGEAELTLFELGESIPVPETTGQPSHAPQHPDAQLITWARHKDAVARGIIQSLCNIQIQAEAVEAEFSFPPEFVGFSGHFRGNPVLPGVVMIHAGLLLAQLCSEKELQLCSVTRAKFVEPVYPYDLMSVELKRVSGDNEAMGKYSVQVRCRGKRAAKFTIGTKPVEKKELQ